MALAGKHTGFSAADESEILSRGADERCAVWKMNLELPAWW
jgi:hypothetical protein